MTVMTIAMMVVAGVGTARYWTIMVLFTDTVKEHFLAPNSSVDDGADRHSITHRYF